MEPAFDLERLIAEWSSLSRWERAEVGRSLRRAGWTYGEIMERMPVGKGTLAGWCKDIRLTEEQIAAIKERRPAGVRSGIPVDTQRKRREQIERIRADAKAEVADLLLSPLWLAGVVLYWSEGSKTRPRLELTNSDDRALRLFIEWARSFHDPFAEFTLALHLHEGNDEPAARDWWAQTLRFPNPHFYPTFIKPAGTGHRKNRLPQGVCRVAMRKSANAFHRTMAWIDRCAEKLLEPR
ncbi:MAG TPA: hypothetical protein VID03_07175 [Acidimicrobiia bacterium]|jgi:hypothetical protein